MTDRDGCSARSNSKFEDNYVSSDPRESSPLLPREQSNRHPRLDLSRMSWILGAKRPSSCSPPPLSRHAPAPPPSPHGDMIDTPRRSTSETRSSALSTPSESRSPSRKRHTNMHSPSLTLENCGSVARDHLASERTFLAYVRTSLAIASTGVALVQLFTISGFSSQNPSSLSFDTPRIQAYARPLGATTVVLGLVTLVIGLVRYFTIQSALTQGNFPVARTAIAFIAVALSALVVIVFAVLDKAIGWGKDGQTALLQRHLPGPSQYDT